MTLTLPTPSRDPARLHGSKQLPFVRLQQHPAMRDVRGNVIPRPLKTRDYQLGPALAKARVMAMDLLAEHAQ